MKTTGKTAGGDAYNYERFRLETYDALEDLPGPEVGEEAYDFAAEGLDGRTERLSDYHGRPVVLVTGSRSCPEYVGKIAAMNGVARRHPEAAFLTLYVREVHPGKNAPPHRSMEDKRAAARRAAAEDGEGAEVLVDDLEGTVHRAYGPLPNIVYVVDADGKVAMRGGWNDPRVVEEALSRLERGESLAGMRSGMNPVSPLVAARVLGRVGRDALFDFLVTLPKMISRAMLARFEDRVPGDTGAGGKGGP